MTEAKRQRRSGLQSVGAACRRVVDKLVIENDRVMAAMRRPTPAERLAAQGGKVGPQRGIAPGASDTRLMGAGSRAGTEGAATEAAASDPQLPEDSVMAAGIRG